MTDLVDQVRAHARCDESIRKRGVGATDGGHPSVAWPTVRSKRGVERTTTPTRNTYRVTKQPVPKVVLTSKQKLCFSIKSMY